MTFLRRVKITNPKLLISFLSTVVPFAIWLMATISFLYATYIGPIIFNFSQEVQILIYLLLPFTGLFTGILSYKTKKTKIKLAIIIVNILLLGIVVLGAVLRIS